MISIVITCHGEANDLPVIIGSLENQKEYHVGKCSRTGVPVQWVAGEPYKEKYEAIVCSDGPHSKWDMYYDSYEVIECPKKGSPGHHTREPGINAATGDYVVLTNADNYFVSGFLHRIETVITPMTGMVYWDCVNNLWKWGTHGGSKIQRGCIDLSCACIKLDIAKQVGFPFRNYDGDYDYIEACYKEVRRQGLDVKYIKETLSVHN